jgi:hypothetical protein
MKIFSHAFECRTCSDGASTTLRFYLMLISLSRKIRSSLRTMILFLCYILTPTACLTSSTVSKGRNEERYSLNSRVLVFEVSQTLQSPGLKGGLQLAFKSIFQMLYLVFYKNVYETQMVYK